VYALNLTHSSENANFCESADPFITGAGKKYGALKTSADRYPGAVDSIEHDNDDGVPRRASENNPKALSESSLIEGIVTELKVRVHTMLETSGLHFFSEKVSR
jgi:hypothetical protein